MRGEAWIEIEDGVERQVTFTITYERAEPDVGFPVARIYAEDIRWEDDGTPVPAEVLEHAGDYLDDQAERQWERAQKDWQDLRADDYIERRKERARQHRECGGE